MAFARNIAIFTISVSFLTFVAFFGRLPALRNTPIGFLHRLLAIHIPRALRVIDICFTDGRITGGTSRLGYHLMYESHPLVLIFFLGLITASTALFVPSVWPYLPLHHKLLIPVILALPYLFTYLSARRNTEGCITASNHASQMRHYPYDRILYYPGNHCRTCKFLKPARSKHCSICNTCVARADHHCIWVNNCLGRGNYRWFLALLLSTGVMIAYGAYVAYIVLTPLVRHHYIQYEPWYRYRNYPTNGALWENFDTKLHKFVTCASIALDVGGLCLSGVGLLALLTWPLPLALLAYHVYLIWAGMTTNESAKWADWRDDMNDGVVFLGLRKEEAVEHAKRQPKTGNLDAEEPPTTWPLQSRHIIIRTMDGKPPLNIPSRIKNVAKESSFERCWSLNEVENVYDLGFWENFLEAMR
ncbi:palmitoyltransferase swf1 [Delitschia confertaspora ATCC 74209]|uniref:Palmitoyltransferase n=1 Tax=Delitschia confertaspora ATCC 74209 TaxID=1513339 RepID=A0A9P4JPI0_9PLEO|nr:palmitoyltransferase swf1 [Delitschia confertaspora ATCC 74209]